MAELVDVVAYLCSKYPFPADLSKARLVKMIYLADWRSAIYYGQQITNIEWQFNHYGPYVDDPIRVVQEHPDFQIERTTTAWGNRKEVVYYRGPERWQTLSETDKEVLDFVIETSSGKSWGEFLRLVYATYPVTTQPRYSILNLVDLAATYREVRQALDWGIPAEPAGSFA